MKKQLFFIATLITFGSLNAQQIPNAGFEDWSNFGTYQDPESWYSFNFFSLLGGPIVVSNTTDSHSGTYALKVETGIGDLGFDGEPDTLIGMVSLGSINFTTTVSGAPFIGRPDSLVGWYKLTSPNSIPCYIITNTTKWNSTTNSQTEISGALFMGETSSSYKRFSVPFEYNSTEIPDTLQFFIVNAEEGNEVNNILYVDDLAFIYNSSAAITENNHLFTISPNPAADIVNIESTAAIESIEMVDLNGKIVLTIQEPVAHSEINISELNAGIFICRVKTTSGFIAQERIVKQ